MKSKMLKVWLISLTIFFLNGCASGGQWTASSKPDPWIFPTRPYIQIEQKGDSVCMSVDDMEALLRTMKERELQAMRNGAVIGDSSDTE